VDVYIDEVKVATVDESGVDLWQQGWISDVLPAGTHTVRLVHASGAAVDLDAVRIIGTAPLLTDGTYDDTNAAWFYTSNWWTYNGGGPFSGSLHYSVTPREFAQFSFTGEQFSFSYTRLSDRGVVDVYIDGLKAASVDESGADQWQYVWVSGLLPSGTHTVRLVHASGSVVDIDAVRIIGTAAVLGSGMHDDADPAWFYSVPWQTYSGTGPSAGTLHYSLMPGETAQVSFSGTQFTLMYTQLSDRGQMDVYVDGSYAATIDESGAAEWQHTWISGTYAAGTHTVVFKHKSGTAVDIDAIDVTP